MPDKFGYLLPPEMNAAAAQFEKWEKERGHDLECEVCGNIVWEVPRTVNAIIGDAVDGPAVAKFRLSVVLFVCNKCGNTKTFAASYMNVSPYSEEAPETGETSGEGDTDGS
ncbi:hypothetical protein [Sphingopyxis sp.]|uniref:hypothetical protein n=1 Tax=Sphingopyxis sp. TaxID=1908224 RepID=UPI003D0CC6EF